MISPPNELKYLEILAVLELGVLLAENPGDRLSCLHGRSDDVSIFIPTVRTFFWPLEKKRARRENNITKVKNELFCEKSFQYTSATSDL